MVKCNHPSRLTSNPKLASVFQDHFLLKACQIQKIKKVYKKISMFKIGPSR